MVHEKKCAPHSGHNHSSKEHEIEIDFYDAFQIIILSFGLVSLLRISLLHIYTSVSYVTFNTDLSLYRKKKSLSASTRCSSTFLYLVALGLLLLSSCEIEQIVLLFIHINTNIGHVPAPPPMNYFEGYSSIVTILHFLYIRYACLLHPQSYSISNMLSLAC